MKKQKKCDTMSSPVKKNPIERKYGDVTRQEYYTCDANRDDISLSSGKGENTFSPRLGISQSANPEYVVTPSNIAFEEVTYEQELCFEVVGEVEVEVKRSTNFVALFCRLKNENKMNAEIVNPSDNSIEPLPDEFDRISESVSRINREYF
jgi:hypothetical protein